MKDILIHISEPQLMPGDTEFIKIDDIQNYDDESFENILIQDLLDYFTYDNIQKQLDTIVSKLKTGGSIIVQSIDLKHIGTAIAFDEIDINSVRNALYPYRQSIHNMSHIVEYLAASGCNIIIKKYINNIEYFVLANKL